MSQQSPWRFQYAAKFVCVSHRSEGTSAESRSVVPGEYRTVINVHNPHERAVKLRVKVAVGDRPEFISPFRNTDLGPDGMMRIDCPEIPGFFPDPFPHGTPEGFVVIESSHGLDVVAVYTAGRKWVRSIDVEPVPERKLEHEYEPEPHKRRCDGQHVANFEAEAPGLRPNPWLIGGQMKFFLSHPAAPNLEIETQSGFTGLDCGNLLEVTFATPVSSVEMVLVHFAQPATAVATAPGGAVVDGPKAMVSPQGVPEVVTLAGPNIGKVEIRSPENEVLLLCFAAS